MDKHHLATPPGSKRANQMDNYKLKAYVEIKPIKKRSSLTLIIINIGKQKKIVAVLKAYRRLAVKVSALQWQEFYQQGYVDKNL